MGKLRAKGLSVIPVHGVFPVKHKMYVKEKLKMTKIIIKKNFSLKKSVEEITKLDWV